MPGGNILLDNNFQKSLVRNTWVEIDLNCIEYNLSKARSLIKPQTKIAGVIKANAYGHGAIEIAKTLIANNIDMLAVACITEAIEIRKDYSDIPILVMGYTEDSNLEIAVEQNITTTIFSLHQAEILSNIGGKIDKDPIVHIKINTGMNRLGFDIEKNTLDEIEKIYKLKNIYVEGIFTHLALKSHKSDKLQYELFMELLDRLQARQINIPIKHISDSVAMVQYPDYQLDMIRLGSFMYGVKPQEKEVDLKLAMTFKTQISQIRKIKKGEGVGYDYLFVAPRDTLVGTLPVGYADGYMRSLGGKAEVSIRGKKAPIIGIICMDQCMVDLTDIEEAKVGDEVILLGECGKDSIRLEEIAGKADTNRNEILSIISRRVPRVYIRDDQIVKITDYLLP